MVMIAADLCQRLSQFNYSMQSVSMNQSSIAFTFRDIS